MINQLKNTNSKAYLIASFVCAFVALSVIPVAVGFDYKYWGDESHFYVTIKHFAENFNLKTMLDYDQVTGPVFYYLYAAWGKLISSDIGSLRGFNLIVSAFTVLVLYLNFKYVLKDELQAFISLVAVLVNPYFIGLSFFVFTDMLSLLGALLAFYSYVSGRYFLLIISTLVCVMTRQYTAFIFLSFGIHSLIGLYQGKTKEFYNLVAMGVGFLPFFLLLYLWQGIAPPSGIARWVEEGQNRFHFNYLITYTIFSAIYLAPLLIIIHKSIFRSLATLVAGLVLSMIKQKIWTKLFSITSKH